MSADILVVDDEADIRELIAGILQDEGYETRLAHNSDAALMSIADRRPSLVILDIWLQGSKLDGLDLFNAIKEKHPGAAGRHHFRTRQYRNGRLGHPARCL